VISSSRSFSVFTGWVVTLAWLLLVEISLLVFGNIGALFLVLLFVPFVIAYPLFGMVALVTSTIWQNLVVSMLSAYVSESSTFSAMQGVNFVLLAFVSGVILFNWATYGKAGQFDEPVERLSRYIMYLMCLAFIYFIFGTSRNGFTDSLAYFRNFTNSLLFLVFGLHIAKACRWDDLVLAWLFFAIALFIHASIELFFTEYYYDLINVRDFFDWKFHARGTTLAQYMDLVRTTFFNSPYFEQFGITSLRIAGPNMHNISFGYILSTAAIVMISSKRYILALLALVFTIVIGVKGAFMVVAITGIFTWMAYTGLLPLSRLYLLFCAFMCSCSVVMAILGLHSGDYHVLGLFGGAQGFLSNPLGHGFGSGGNLSAAGNLSSWAAQNEWQAFQQRGSASFGLESSVGVALYQWGVFGIAFLLLSVYVCRLLLRRLEASKEVQHRYLPFLFAYGVIISNLIFQEEAMSPSALGLMSMGLGIILGQPFLRQVGASARRRRLPNCQIMWAESTADSPAAQDL
jgi:hypothetical protein